MEFLWLLPVENATLLILNRYPLLLGGQGQCGMRSLPDTSTHDRQWGSNTNPLDLESGALTTRPCAPMTDAEIATCMCDAFAYNNK